MERKVDVAIEWMTNTNWGNVEQSITSTLQCTSEGKTDCGTASLLEVITKKSNGGGGGGGGDKQTQFGGPH